MYANVVARLVKDPILVSNSSDTKMARGSIAYTSGYGNETSFMNWIAFQKTAEVLLEYCKKGKQLSFAGEIRQNKWKNDDGVEFSDHQMVVNRVEFIDSGSSKKKEEKPSGKENLEKAVSN